MKTSVIHVHDMLSVLSVDEIEKRIGEVPGVESVTLNFAAESATVRYDETRLEVGDIKSVVRQKSNESDAPMTPETKPAGDKAKVPETVINLKPQTGGDKSKVPETPIAATAKPEEDKSKETELPTADKSPEEKEKSDTKPMKAGDSM